MVARMIRWRPCPPLSRKFEVRLVVRRIEGLPPLPPQEEVGAVPTAAAEVRWRGPKMTLSSLRRTVRRNRTREEGVGPRGVVEWEEEFKSFCSLTTYRDSAFHPWEIAFAIFFNGLNQGLKNKAPIIGAVALNLAEFASTSEGKEIETSVPLLLLGVSTESHPTLYLALSLLELRTSQESLEAVQRSVVPICISPPSKDTPPFEKDEFSAFKSGLRKVKILTEFISTRKAKKTCPNDEGSEGRSSAKSDVEQIYPFDTDSLDVDLEEELEDSKEDFSFRKSCSYDTLASTNYIGGSFYFDMMVNDEDWIYYGHRRSDVGYSHTGETPEQPILQTSKKSILSWKKRKPSFRSPKARGEPLLKKSYGENGGDDIDFDRRQLSCLDKSISVGEHSGCDDPMVNQASILDFGDDNFAVGSWELKEVVSRDGHMKLQTQVFFASIDQRSERVAGESACAILVTVIADWFQANQDIMPVKSQIDSLIREGSLEWRNLCENQKYQECFPDKHFDLETVLQVKIRPLSVIPEKSFIGFFHPEGIDETGGFEFLHGAMSFDNVWDEISRAGLDSPVDGSPQLYIVSWNDHFFILKVEVDAYYIIDTLGERLHEGCNRSYILKFDDNTSIHKIVGDVNFTVGKGVEAENQQVEQNNCTKEGCSSGEKTSRFDGAKEELVCRGKESCKEYIKSFLAAIPIREMQVDLKKGLMASTPIHHRLQIEFHYTEPSKEVSGMLPPAAEQAANFLWPAEPIAPAGVLTPTSKLEVEVV
ncbi:uncharacterized protein [Elaeis guineensis]|uniref:Uncharacterized protein LOC105042435 n=1 Tax=Elaeis guineensis var. tenera TaxID=51953 RepID=A0A6J0PF70_ELAGV|nr:uncharacterized protein LOC105042435 [Elaeis guineensis]XP_019704548.1 uncharacterized protein LOC105042435 [Elaeis guineensis]XP_019704550.1 uncharacterized protein LOC105042435 [Elaeis guineensis]